MPDPALAMEIANNAATAFMFELNKYTESVAPFQFQHHAVLAKKVPKIAGGSASVALGVVAGLLAGIAVVGLILVFRRPVVEASAAQEATGLPVIGRIRLPRHGPPKATEDRAIGLLCRRLLGTSVSTIHVAAPTYAQAEQLAGVMAEIFGRLPAVPRPQKRPGGEDIAAVPTVWAPKDADEWLRASGDHAYTLLATPRGISSRKLRLFAEGHDTGNPTGVVLVTTHRGIAKPAVKS